MTARDPSEIIQKILRKILTSGPVKSGVAYSKRVALPGFDNMPLYDVADFFFTGIQKVPS